jgi:hypothetical protein
MCASQGAAVRTGRTAPALDGAGRWQLISTKAVFGFSLWPGAEHVPLRGLIAGNAEIRKRRPSCRVRPEVPGGARDSEQSTHFQSHRLPASTFKLRPDAHAGPRLIQSCSRYCELDPHAHYWGDHLTGRLHRPGSTSIMTP